MLDCQGPEGPQGAAGAQGTPGVQGDPGAQGIAGPSGIVSSGYAAGAVTTPTATTAFISITTQVTVATGQSVHITSNAALGSLAVGGANKLDIYPCYRPSTSTATPTNLDAGLFNLRVPQFTRFSFGISGVFKGLTAGTYDVGMCGDDDGDGNWNNNEWSYTSVLVYSE